MTNLLDDGVRADVTRRLGAPWAGRPVIIGPVVLAGFTKVVEWFLDLGCPVLVVATSRGVGPIPPDGSCEVAWLDPPATASLTEEVRLHDRMVHRLPDDLRAAVDAFDPERRGLWYTTPFVTTDEPVDGRPVTGGRPASFLALEDKLLADAIWDAAEVERAPYRIVDLADDAALDAATARARRRSWARCGPATPATASTAAATSCAGCATTATGPRPRRSSGHAATGCGCCRSSRACRARSTGSCCPTVRRCCGRSRSSRCATRRRARWPTAGWAAPGTRRRRTARRCAPPPAAWARTCSATHGYRGAFGIDGVLTADGFRPTELNTRMSAGATALGEVDRRFFTFLQAALVAGTDPGLTAADVEGLVPAMDDRPRRQGRRVRRGHGGRRPGELPGHLGRPVVRARRGGDRQPVPGRLRPERAVRQGGPVHRGGAGRSGWRRSTPRSCGSSTRRTAPRSGRWSPRPTSARAT